MAEEIARVTDGIDDVNAAWGNAVIEGLAMRSMMPGRLSASSTLAEPTSDLTGVASLYYKLTNRHGVYGGLYKGGFVRGYDMSAVPALSMASLEPYSIHDIYMHADDDEPELEAAAWTQPDGAITNVTNASPIVVTSAGHGLSNEDLIAIYDVEGNLAANGIWMVANKTTDTFELYYSVGSGAYTTGGTWRKLNVSAPTRDVESGFLVKSGDPTRRLLGTVLIDAAGGSVSDNNTWAGVDNLYNARRKKYFLADATSSWTSSIAGWRPANANVNNRIVAVFCRDVYADVFAEIVAQTASGAALSTGVGLKTINIPITNTLRPFVSNSSVNMPLISSGTTPVIAGATQFTWLTYQPNTTTVTFFGTGTQYKSGMILEIMR